MLSKGNTKQYNTVFCFKSAMDTAQNCKERVREKEGGVRVIQRERGREREIQLEYERI